MLLQVYLTTGLFVIVSWISFIVPPEVVPGTNKIGKKGGMSMCVSEVVQVVYEQTPTFIGTTLKLKSFLWEDKQIVIDICKLYSKC